MVVASQTSAQLVASLDSKTETEIKRIVTHRGSAPVLTRQDLGQSRSLSF
jgi:hypothetical protein